MGLVTLVKGMTLLLAVIMFIYLDMLIGLLPIHGTHAIGRMEIGSI